MVCRSGGFARVCLALALVVAGVVAGVAAWPGAGTAQAFDVCTEEPADPNSLITITSPAPGPYGYGGPAPVTLTVQIREGLAIFQSGSLRSTIDWGDGASSIVKVSQCPGGGDSFWPSQSLSHVYSTPGTYRTTWNLFSDVGNFSVPFVVLVVTDAAPPPTPTPTPVPPTPTPSPLPATPTQPSTAQPTATPSGGAPAGVTATAVAASATATGTASPSPTSASATAASTPQAPAAAGSGATPTAAPIQGRAASTVVANQEYRPRSFLAVREIDEISTSPDVILTNLVIAGFTVWVLFSTVLLNQVLQSNRAEIDRKTARFTAPFKKGLRRPAWWVALPEWAHMLALPALVLVLTGIVYSILEPGFGLNEHTLVLFGSAVAGVGLMTYLCSGLEAAAMRRWLRAEAVVRPFPACIAIAAGSVAISRLLDLQPGVMYGFVASCAVAAPVAATQGQGGRIALVPVVAAVTVAVGAWLLVGPIRGLNDDDAGWLPALLEATVIVVFIGGIEGTVLSMVPLAETDGGKIFRWSRWLWFAIALAAAFLAWHVLFGRERSYFSGLRQATSLTVVAAFVFYTAATAGAWAYFRFRKQPTMEHASGPSTAG